MLPEKANTTDSHSVLSKHAVCKMVSTYPRHPFTRHIAKAAKSYHVLHECGCPYLRYIDLDPTNVNPANCTVMARPTFIGSLWGRTLRI
jgi:hypothetical protein